MYNGGYPGRYAILRKVWQQVGGKQIHLRVAGPVLFLSNM